MKQIVVLSDYQNKFGSKHFDTPYRSGMDKDLLTYAFRALGYNLQIRKMSEAFSSEDPSGVPVLYTSQEDPDYLYKSFIEDVVYGLELSGYNVIPSYRYLRANNNKVFMEILRKTMLPESYSSNCMMYGCLEDLISQIDLVTFPCVIKQAAGACSVGVHLAHNRAELIKAVKRISRSRSYIQELRDIGRLITHRGYQRVSLFRNKFIVQDYIPGLSNDWKVLVYQGKYFVLRRNNRPGDFRASGSGIFSFDDQVDEGLLDTAEELFSYFNLPMISFDLAKTEDKFVLIEMQFVCFGTTTLEKSPYYYTKGQSGWNQINAKSVLEEEYARSVVEYLNENL